MIVPATMRALREIRSRPSIVNYVSYEPEGARRGIGVARGLRAPLGVVRGVGFEPTTHGLKNRCSASELPPPSFRADGRTGASILLRSISIV